MAALTVYSARACQRTMATSPIRCMLMHPGEPASIDAELAQSGMALVCSTDESNWVNARSGAGGTRWGQSTHRRRNYA